MSQNILFGKLCSEYGIPNACFHFSPLTPTLLALTLIEMRVVLMYTSKHHKSNSRISVRNVPSHISLSVIFFVSQKQIENIHTCFVEIRWRWQQQQQQRQCQYENKIEFLCAEFSMVRRINFGILLKPDIAR